MDKTAKNAAAQKATSNIPRAKNSSYEQNIQLDTETLDAVIARELHDNGRAAVQYLARRIGVSRDIISSRLKALRSSGSLRVVAALDPSIVGHHLLVHTRVEVDGPTTPIAQWITEQQDSVFVSLVSGKQSLVFESRHADAQELHAFLNDLRSANPIRSLTVSTYVQVLKGFYVAETPPTARIDKLDRELIALLQLDGRKSFRELAKLVHLSPTAVRARVTRLLDENIIRILAIRSGGIINSRLAIGLGINLRDTSRDFHEYLRSCPELEFATVAHGGYDVIATLAGDSPNKLISRLEQIRSMPEVATVESWTHFNVLKEDYTRRNIGVMRIDEL